MTGAQGPAAPGKKPEPAADLNIPTKPGWYTCGCQGFGPFERPPRHSITFGGVSFPEFSQDENPTIKNDTIEYNQRRRGQRVWLTETDLVNVRNACGKRLVRVRSLERQRFAVIMKDSPAAGRPLEHDVPLERFLYIEPAEDPSAAQVEAYGPKSTPIL